MAEEEIHGPSLESFTLPYRRGEFQEVADRLGRLADSLTAYPALNVVTQEMRGAATALCRAEGLLGATVVPPVVQEEPEPTAAPASQAETAAEAAPAKEVGQRGEWQGRVGRQPEFTRVRDGRLRGEFYLAQHPDPSDREKTEWLRCYNLDRHAEALQKKGRLAGAEVVVRGSFQVLIPSET